MSRGVKIALVVIGIVLVLCCIGGVATYFITARAVGQAFTTDSKQAAKIGHEIVDYTLPSGYQEQGGIKMVGIKMVIIAEHRTSQSGDRMALTLMQFPAGLNLSQEDMERQMSQTLAQQGQRGSEPLQVVGTQKVTVKGQPVTLTISEASGSEGVHRQATGVFPGKDGLVMLMAFGTKADWDQATLDQFLASIK
jgi:hypothetical protein